METATFDTHQAVKAIARSGLKDTQAEAIVTTINNAMNQSLATKSDILAVKVDMEAFKGEMKGEMLVLKWMVGLIIVVEALPFLKFLFA